MSTEPSTALRVDAHHHLWDLEVRDQEWTRDLPVLRRSFLFDELVPHLGVHGFDGAVLVQTITVPEETSEFLAMAEASPDILGVTGWVDLTDPEVASAIARLQALQGGRWLKAIRHQVQGEPDPRWLLREDVRRGLAAVADAGLAYELLVTHDQLPAAVEVVERVPGLRWILDHAGKPPVATGELLPWSDQIAALAANPAVACKLSGLVTEAAEQWTVADLAPYADQVLHSFGADRVMFGSDWPVCLLRADYAQVVATAESFFEQLTPSEQAAVWGGTATRWYGLESRSD
jgi:L-fuconolactonase